MSILILNGSPRKKGTIAALLKNIANGIASTADIDWVDVYDLDMKPCKACMKCRPDGECIFSEDGAHVVGRKIKQADGLIVGTPTHWGNMSTQLKCLFDRNVPVFMGEKSNGLPIPRQKGKSAAIVTACSTPWPLNFLAAESRGAIHAVKEVLHYGGYKLVGKLAVPGTKNMEQIPEKYLIKARQIGAKF